MPYRYRLQPGWPNTGYFRKYRGPRLRSGTRRQYADWWRREMQWRHSLRVRGVSADQLEIRGVLACPGRTETLP